MFTLVGIALATWVAVAAVRAEAHARYGRSRGDAHIYAVAFAAIVGGLVGSRLFHVIDHWPTYSGDLARIAAYTEGGQSVVGGLAGGAIAAVAVLVARRLPVGIALDGSALGIPFGMALGRVGDLINGEHWSARCDGLAWCVRYTHPASEGQRTFVHPVVGYELVLDLLIGMVIVALHRARGRALGDGGLLFAFLILYGSARLVVTFLRIDAPLWGPLALAQWSALLFVVAGIAGTLWLRPRLASASRAPRPTS